MGWFPCSDCCGGGGYTCVNCNGGSAPLTVSVTMSGVANNTCAYCNNWNGTFISTPDVVICQYSVCTNISSPYCGGLSGYVSSIDVELTINPTSLQVIFEPMKACNPFPFNAYRTTWVDNSFTGDCSSGATYTPTLVGLPTSTDCDYTSASMTVTF